MFLVVLLLFCITSSEAIFKAGVAKLDGTLPIGTPLAGFNHGQRRVPDWPLPVPAKYTTFMTPSVGVLDPTWVRAVVIDDGTTEFAIVTIDAIGADGTMNALAHDIATGMGFTVPLSNCLFSSSHSHSGPGAISPSFLWAMAPATDLLVPELQRMMAETVANALVKAQQNKANAVMNITTGYLIGVTQNRRASISPYVRRDSIDPYLGLIRIDDEKGSPLATIWNYAIHGVCYGPDNMKFSGDIMGRANDLIEEATGGLAFFINADAGDIDPAAGMCDPKPDFKGSHALANAVLQTRSSVGVTNDVTLRVASQVIDFGPTQLNATLERFLNCTHGGPIDICYFCFIFKCDENLHLYSSWIETAPRFTALNINVAGIPSVLGSVPGEPLLELGWWLRNDTLKAGFVHTILAGYSNSHMGYFATPDEYDIGGYESQLTLWGYNTTILVRSAFDTVLNLVK